MLLQTPFSRWPLRWHLMIVASLVALAGVAAWSMEQSSRRQQEALAARKSDMLRELAALAATSDAARQGPTLAAPASVDAVSRDITRFAASAGVELRSLGLQHSAASATELGRVQYAITGACDYRAAKVWLGELLARYPALAVQSLDLRSTQADGSKLSVAVSLVLFLKA